MQDPQHPWQTGYDSDAGAGQAWAYGRDGLHAERGRHAVGQPGHVELRPG